MSENSVKYRQRIAPTMIWVTLFAGITGFFYQFMVDGTLLTFMVSAAAVGGLVGASMNFDERDKLLLLQSYAKAFEYLFVVIFFFYAFMLLAGWLGVGSGVIGFANGHWVTLLASTMCILLGSVGLINFREVR